MYFHLAGAYLASLAFGHGVYGYRGGPVNTTKICGPYDTVPSGDYTLLNNLWGLASINPPPTGYGCSNINRRDNYSIAWAASFAWTDFQFYTKGFTCVQQNLGVGQKLLNIASMPTLWQYNVTTLRYPDLTFNMAYDMFTAKSSSLNAPYTNEIMIWPTTHFMVPVTTFDVLGKPIIRVSNLSLAGYLWNFYTGVRNNIPVWSIVLIEGSGDKQPINATFKMDIMIFMNYLISNAYINQNEYLTVVQAGTEVIKAGASVVNTTYYNTDIKWLPGTSASSSLPPATSASSSLSPATSASSLLTPAASSTKKVTSTVATSTTKTLSPSSTPKTWKLTAACLLDPFPNQLLRNGTYISFNNTPSQCTQRCDTGGWIYAGVEFGSNCYCGSVLNPNPQNGAGNWTSISMCTSPCSGNLTQTCGGLGAMALYQKQ